VPISNSGYQLSRYAMQQRDKDMEIQRFFSAVGDSLKQIVAIHDAHPELPAESRARALIHFGDWNLLKRKHATAVEHYRRAYQLLAADADGAEILDRHFGAPKSIPTLRLPVPQVDQKLNELASQSYVTVAVDITKRGDAKNFRVVEQSDPTDEGAASTARQKVRDGRFRPRFENGEPVDTPAFEIKISERAE
jgi:hypothetical protein